jgi:hypothetical protein
VLARGKLLLLLVPGYGQGSPVAPLLPPKLGQEKEKDTEKEAKEEEKEKELKMKPESRGRSWS